MEKKEQNGPRQYTVEYKEEALKLADEVGNGRAASELGIAESTLSNWRGAAKRGLIDCGIGKQTSASGLSLAAEIQQLRADNKAQQKR